MDGRHAATGSVDGSNDRGAWSGAARRAVGGTALIVGLALVAGAAAAVLDLGGTAAGSGAVGAPSRIVGALVEPVHAALHGPSPSGAAPADLARTAQWLLGAVALCGLALGGLGVALFRRAES